MHSFAWLTLLALCAVSMASMVYDPCLSTPNPTKCREDNAKRFGLNRAEFDTNLELKDRGEADIGSLYSRFSETNFVGGDIGGGPDPKIRDNYEDCVFDCIETSNCKGFTWDIESRECFLKEGDWKVREKGNRISGLVKKHVWDIYHRLPNVQLVGGGIGGRRDFTRKENVESCAVHCLKTPLCRGFTYGVRDHQCFVKEGGWTEEQHDDRISGTIVKSEDRMLEGASAGDDKDDEDRRRKDNYDCPGNDFEEFDGIRLDDCERRCRRQEHHHREQKCRGIAYDPTASHCWLKFKMDNCHPIGNRITIFM